MNHETYIKRCLQIAKNGIGTTRPNPSVGSVLVVDDKIIGEGFTSPYGGSHAEVNAIVSVEDKSLLSKATLYVTLEPCSHFGKTPPCSDLIIASGIKNVVIGCVDDNSLVAGKGIEKLKNAGCNVLVGVLEVECKEHHKRFFTFHNKKRPYIILKWAETQDGFIAPKTRNKKAPVWITNTYSRQLVHQWRAEEHGILVGAKTVLEDNPTLTVRDVEGNNPVRIVLDNRNSLSKEFNIFNDEAETILINETEPKEILDQLFLKNIQSVIIEGGAKTLQGFIDAGLWDEARVFVGNVSFKEGVKAPIFDKSPNKVENLQGDTINYYKND